MIVTGERERGGEKDRKREKKVRDREKRERDTEKGERERERKRERRHTNDARRTTHDDDDDVKGARRNGTERNESRPQASGK